MKFYYDIFLIILKLVVNRKFVSDLFKIFLLLKYGNMYSNILIFFILLILFVS